MLKFNSYSIQGRRTYQEDRIANTFTPIGHYFAVIDGHGGENTAEYIQNYIYNKTFQPENYEEMFEKIHNEVIKQYEDGACLLLARVSNEGEYEIAWVGDCVAFLKKQNTTLQLNKIHNLDNKQEVERIKKEIGRLDRSGPYLMSSKIRDYGLIPTRTIGDKDFEIDGVSHKPEIITGKLEQGESLILVTDGVTDVLSKDQLIGTAEKIVMRAYKNNSKDNISAIVITLE